MNKNLKRVSSVLLALMVFSMPLISDSNNSSMWKNIWKVSAAISPEDDADEEEEEERVTVDLNKVYKLLNEGTTSPAEVFSFDISMNE